jgi:hypothetical protein
MSSLIHPVTEPALSVRASKAVPVVEEEPVEVPVVPIP